MQCTIDPFKDQSNTLWMNIIIYYYYHDYCFHHSCDQAVPYEIPFRVSTSVTHATLKPLESAVMHDNGTHPEPQVFETGYCVTFELLHVEWNEIETKAFQNDKV